MAYSAVGNKWFNIAKGRLLNGDLIPDTATIKAMLIIDAASSPVFNIDDDYVNSYSTYEAVVGGGSYARQTLTSVSGSTDDTNNRGELTCGTITFTSVASQAYNIVALLIYEHLGADDSANPLIAFFDTGTGFPLTANGGNITVTINAEGLLQIT